ncbi:MAG: septal ring lytic transglycosylase RlpA family protein [Gammaproteobacteria bacterium]|nr:septal ring lytic transglycosylase RlpA family protein [Gammaproteobacteria bacterium]
MSRVRLPPPLRAGLMVGALLLAACAGRPPRPSPPATRLPPARPDAAPVPDAVPRAEPRSARGNPAFYVVAGKRYVVLPSAAGYLERGVASWYGPDFHGKRTASGEDYDMYAMTAAHKTLPVPCYARITNLANGRSIVVRINDRGPFVGNRIIDLSYSAAARLDMLRNGTAFVEVRTVGPGETGTVAASGTISPAVAAATAAPVTPPGLYIQVGAFADAGNAQRLLERLQAAGLTQAFIASRVRGDRLARVRLGPLASVAEFDTLNARLVSLGYGEARLAQD